MSVAMFQLLAGRAVIHMAAMPTGGVLPETFPAACGAVLSRVQIAQVSSGFHGQICHVCLMWSPAWPTATGELDPELDLDANEHVDGVTYVAPLNRIRIRHVLSWWERRFVCLGMSITLAECGYLVYAPEIEDAPQPDPAWPLCKECARRAPIPVTDSSPGV